MTRGHRVNVAVWLALVVLATLEFGASFLPLAADVRPMLMLPAAGMATIVALFYMRLASAPDLARALAIAGVFWLAVLLGLAMLDPLTRVVYPVSG